MKGVSDVLTFGSLFSGIGGLDLGFERAGMRCLWQCEKDEFCRRVLRKHWPATRLFEDVKDVDGDAERPDLIIGGDPCQENSNARQGDGLESPSLGADFIRVVDAVRPRIVVRENPSAVRADAPWPWWRFRTALQSLGYVVLPFRLRACCLGADHQRDRLFLLAERADALQAGSQGAILEEVERAAGSESIRHIAQQDRRNPAPRISRSDDGIPDRVDRIRACGNAVHVAVAEWIGRRIVEAFK